MKLLAAVVLVIYGTVFGQCTNAKAVLTGDFYDGCSSIDAIRYVGAETAGVTASNVTVNYGNCDGEFNPCAPNYCVGGTKGIPKTQLSLYQDCAGNCIKSDGYKGMTSDNCGACEKISIGNCSYCPTDKMTLRGKCVSIDDVSTWMLDACGVPGGDNSTCKDCLGVVNGFAEIDLCGVCNGNGTSCVKVGSLDKTVFMSDDNDIVVVEAAVKNASSDKIQCVFADATSGAIVKTTNCSQKSSHFVACLQPSTAGEYKVGVRSNQDTSAYASQSITIYSSQNVRVSDVQVEEDMQSESGSIDVDDSYSTEDNATDGSIRRFQVTLDDTYATWRKDKPAYCILEGDTNETKITINGTQKNVNGKVQIECPYRPKKNFTGAALKVSASYDGINKIGKSGRNTDGVQKVLKTREPTLNNVQFDEDHLRLQFDTDLDTSALDLSKGCAQLFEADALAKLGNNPNCSTPSKREIVVKYGSITDANRAQVARPGAQLSLKSGVLRRSSGNAKPDASLSRALSTIQLPSLQDMQADPDYAQQAAKRLPRCRILSPSRFSPCGTLTVKAAGIRGSGKVYNQWKSLLNGQAVDLKNYVIGDLNGSTVQLDMTKFKNGDIIQLYIEMMNFLNETRRAWKNITVTSNDLPFVTLKPNRNPGTVRIDKNFEVKADVFIPDCSMNYKNNKKVRYTWTITAPGVAATRLQQIVANATDKPFLRFSPGDLPGNATGSVTVKTAFEGSEQQTDEATLQFMSEQQTFAGSMMDFSDIVLGNGTEGQNFKLNASTLQNTMKSMQKVKRVVWSCQAVDSDGTRKPCMRFNMSCTNKVDQQAADLKANVVSKLPSNFLGQVQTYINDKGYLPNNTQLEKMLNDSGNKQLVGTLRDFTKNLTVMSPAQQTQVVGQVFGAVPTVNNATVNQMKAVQKKVESDMQKASAAATREQEKIGIRMSNSMQAAGSQVQSTSQSMYQGLASMMTGEAQASSTLSLASMMNVLPTQQGCQQATDMNQPSGLSSTDKTVMLMNQLKPMFRRRRRRDNYLTRRLKRAAMDFSGLGGLGNLLSSSGAQNMMGQVQQMLGQASGAGQQQMQQLLNQVGGANSQQLQQMLGQSGVSSQQLAQLQQQVGQQLNGYQQQLQQTLQQAQSGQALGPPKEMMQQLMSGAKMTCAGPGGQQQTKLDMTKLTMMSSMLMSEESSNSDHLVDDYSYATARMLDTMKELAGQDTMTLMSSALKDIAALDRTAVVPNAFGKLPDKFAQLTALGCKPDIFPAVERQGDSVLTVNSSELQPGNYELMLKVFLEDGSQLAHKIKMRIEDKHVPLVKPQGAARRAKVSRSDAIPVEVAIDTDGELNEADVSIEPVREDGYGYVELTNDKLIDGKKTCRRFKNNGTNTFKTVCRYLVKPNTFPANTNLKWKVKAKNVNGKDAAFGYAEVTTAGSVGRCNVRAPPKCNSMTDKINLEVSDCMGESDNPFQEYTYEFGEMTSNNGATAFRSLDAADLDSTTELLCSPPSDASTRRRFAARVCDDDDCSVFEAGSDTEIVENNVDKTTLDKLLEKASARINVTRETGCAMRDINAIATHVQRQMKRKLISATSADADEVKVLARAGQDLVNRSREALQSGVSDADVQAIMQEVGAGLDIAKDAMTIKTEDLQAIRNLTMTRLKKADVDSCVLTKAGDFANKMMRFEFESLIPPSSSKNGTTTTPASTATASSGPSQGRQLLTGLARPLLQNMNPTLGAGPQDQQQGNTRLRVVSDYVAENDTIAGSSDAKACKVKLGKEAANLCAPENYNDKGQMSYGCKMQFAEMDEDTVSDNQADKAKTCSKVVDFQIADSTDGTVKQVKNLKEPIELTLQPKTGKQLLACKVLDESTGKWSTDGITTVKNADGSVTCRTSHLSTFAADGTDATGAGSGGGSGGSKSYRVTASIGSVAMFLMTVLLVK